MMTRTNFVAVAFLCSALSAGCLSTEMEGWKGKQRDALIRAWGPPTQEAKLEDGGKSLVYVQQTGWLIPMATGGSLGAMVTCRKVFNTDANNVIRSWSLSGDC